MGASNEEITIDVIMCNKNVRPINEAGSTIHNWEVARDIKGYYGSTNNMVEQFMAAPGVTLRWFI